jgi:glutamine amidotransferase
LIAILDYGMGNLRSVEKAIQHVGGDCRIQTDLADADKLIIPGVGAFPAAMERLEPLRSAIHDFMATGRPVLGICLGQQLLFESGEEGRETAGLGLIPGRVRRLPPTPGLKVPHMGWTSLEVVAAAPLLKGVPEHGQVYFVHSYYADCKPEYVAAWAQHGIRFAAAVRKDNLWGLQFHPEKSGDIGLGMLENFVRW